MTISSEVSPIKRYTCNGVTTAFPTIFQFFDEDHLKVVFVPHDTSIAETTLILTTNYTVSGGNGSTGTVTTTGADPLGNTPYDDGDLVIIRETPLTQEIASRTTGAFRPPNIENGLDKTCMQMQERDNDLEFALSLPDTTDLTEVSAQLPTLEASKFLGVDASGTSFIFAESTTGVPVSTYGASLIDDLTAASALQTLLLDTDLITLSLPANVTISDYAKTVLDDLTAASTLQTLGLSAYFRTLVNAVTASDLRTLLAMPRSYLTGLGMANAADANHDITIAAGQARDNSDIANLFLSIPITKQIDAPWAAGSNAGGLFSGVVATGTWYHTFLIRKDSDGSSDAGFDTSITAANIPAGYTNYRRVGSILTDVNASITAFLQIGDDFYWKDPPEDYDEASPGTNEITEALSYVPPGVSVKAKINAYTAANEIYLHHPDIDDEAPSNTTAPGCTDLDADGASTGLYEIPTDTSAQIQFRLSNDTQTNLFIVGWVDRRGRDD